MMHIRLFFLFLFLSFTSLAQQPDSIPWQKADFSLIRNSWNDGWALAAAPVHWRPGQFIAAGAVLTLTAALTTQDLEIAHFSQHNRTSLTDNLSSYGFRHWGDGLYSMPLMGAFYLYSISTHDARSRETALLGVEAFGVSGAYTGVVKQLFHRHRPYQSDDPYVWDGPFVSYNFKTLTQSGYNSFPSGHTQAAFAVAAIVASEYKDKPAVPIIAYALAGLCGLSRMNDNKHWASDVFCAAALGIANGKFIYHRQKARNRKTLESSY